MIHSISVEKPLKREKHGYEKVFKELFSLVPNEYQNFSREKYGLHNPNICKQSNKDIDIYE